LDKRLRLTKPQAWWLKRGALWTKLYQRLIQRKPESLQTWHCIASVYWAFWTGLCARGRSWCFAC